MNRTKQNCLKNLDQDTYKKARKLNNNTFEYIINGHKKIRLHDTDIITFSPNGCITLNSGGWQTPTTKNRMNEYTRFYIYQENSIWYISVNGKEYVFADGITIHPDGEVTNAGANPKEKLKLKKQIQKYCKDFVNELFKGNFPKPSNGDCWGCLFVSKNNNMPLDTSHLLEHIQEKYYVPSLLIRAIDETPISKIAKHHLGYLMNYHDVKQNFGLNIARDQIEKSLKRFMYRKLELAR